MLAALRSRPWPLSPDGAYYLAAARGELVPRPYSRRWLLPRLLGPEPWRWAVLTYSSLALLPLVAWAYFAAVGLHGARLAGAVALLVVLPGVWRCSWRFPVLLDAPSFVLALAAAAVARGGPPWAAVLLALLGGATRETVPIFAAIWAWDPAPLVGLAAAGGWRSAAAPDQPWLARPVREALALRARLGWDWALYLRPWGAALAGLVAPTWQTAAAVLVAHAQLLAAQDTIRLAAWAAPVLVAGAVRVLPVELLAAAVVVTLVATGREGRV